MIDLIFLAMLLVRTKEGAEMFSQVYVYYSIQGGGDPIVTITHDALDLTVQGTHLPTMPWTPSRRETGITPVALAPTGDIWWPLLSNWWDLLRIYPCKLPFSAKCS